MSTQVTGSGLADALAGARVVVGPALDGEHLQATARGQVGGVVRKEAVEAGRAAVLGLVDDAGARVDRHRLVVEPAHGRQRDGVDRPVGVRRHLEDVAVGLRPVLAGEALLAGQPGALRRGSTGAVADGAREARVVAHQLHGGGVELEVGRATGGARVVAGRRVGGPDALLVVADQAHGRPGACEGRHAVVSAGGQDAVAHRRPGAAEGRVGEARRQQQLTAGCGLQGAVAAVVRCLRTAVVAAARRRLRGAGEERAEGGRAPHRSRSGGAPLQEGSTSDGGVGHRFLISSHWALRTGRNVGRQAGAQLNVA